ncbi:hypothetical protein NITLEN_10141 [Nitrospira lenta]|uniref:Uncharacterized protein n=1 Tax=Nitrospira lenta TaxID=1436998 RepID=A0A330KZX3_9BACT|nr:hypothetical protein NITLEN_10141 [Nitrospira lenta]
MPPARKSAMTEASGSSWKNTSAITPKPNSAMVSASPVSKSFILVFTQTSCYRSFSTLQRVHYTHGYSDRRRFPR